MVVKKQNNPWLHHHSLCFFLPFHCDCFGCAARILSSAKSELSSSLMALQMASYSQAQTTSTTTPPSSAKDGKQAKAQGGSSGRAEAASGAGTGSGSGSGSEGERSSSRGGLFGRARSKRGDGSGSAKGSPSVLQQEQKAGEAQATEVEPREEGAGVQQGDAKYRAPQQFLNTARRVVQFADVPRALSAVERVVYIDGAFDLFHTGHVKILEDARALGDHLLVGVHLDATVSANRGPHHPVMGLHERCMSVLACRHVDDVILGAPWVITKDLLKTFNVSLVVRGTVAEPNPLAHDEQERARFEVPEKMGILKVLESRSPTTTSSVMQRVLESHEAFQQRYQSRTTREQVYYEEKEYVPEA